VSLVCFAGKEEACAFPHRFDGKEVAGIYADLTVVELDSVDLTRVKRLMENQLIAFLGTKKAGPFNISGELARQWLLVSMNPNRHHNVDILFPWTNGEDITNRPSDQWVIYFGVGMKESEASFYEIPFKYVLTNCKPIRDKNCEKHTRERYWLFKRSAPDLYASVKGFDGKSRYIITPRVSKYRLFVWRSTRVIADDATVAITRDDDTTFGILHSRFHEAWTLRLCTWLGVGNDPRYTPSTTFETFPFPEGLTPNIPARAYANDPRAQKIAAAAKRLDQLRNNWLNPPDLVMRVPEVVEGYPDRILLKNEAAAAVLKKRTLTTLYHERPTWLDHAHRALDAAVANAYDWKPDMSDDQMLTKLLALNVARAEEGE
jgi:type II restriction/modification system DNA methylase subunit YeeA